MGLKNRKYWDAATTSKHVEQEILKGLNALNATESRIISFFGSARVKPKDKSFIHCQRLAESLGRKGYAILSGGGPGIMLAANTGAMKAGAPSLGFKAALLTKEKVNKTVFTKEVRFNFMFVRRFVLAIKSDALIFYPGGYGTLNELFEYLTLMQTGMVDKVPVLLVDKKYWKEMEHWLETHVLKEAMIDRKDLKLIHYVDTQEDILKLLAKK